jgi:hypothetical protein
MHFISCKKMLLIRPFRLSISDTSVPCGIEAAGLKFGPVIS